MFKKCYNKKVVFSFCGWCPLLYVSFLVDVVPLVDFCFCCFCLGGKSKKSSLRGKSKSLLPMFFPQFYSFRSYVQVFNPLELIPVSGTNSAPDLFFCM